MGKSKNALPVPLYHGTSTIFLDDIINFGLGGCNQLKNWQVFEFAKAIHPYVLEHLAGDEEWMLEAQSFGCMAEQRVASMNFQHGDTYLTPSVLTAVRYATSNRYGSEILSSSLKMLQELMRRKIPSVSNDLRDKYCHLYDMLNIPAAPLLIRVEQVAKDELLSEAGGNPADAINFIKQLLSEDAKNLDIFLQQSNFRLKGVVELSRLSIRLINVTKCNKIFPEYSLHQLICNRSQA